MIKKRIAIFGIKYFPSKGGTSRVVESLLWDIKEQFEITIYCYKHPGANDNVPGVQTVQFSEIPIKGLGVFLFYLRCCIHLLIYGKYHLVHVHKTDAAFFLPLLERKFKVITTSHALPFLDDKWKGIGKYYFKLAERIFIRSKGMVTTISKSQATYYNTKYGRPVHFIPNGIQLPDTEQLTSVKELFLQHKISGNYILFAARRIIPLKGCHTLIKALKQINFQKTLVISGDYEQMPSYTEQLRREAGALDVKFIGYIADQNLLNALIKGADYFVFPSEIEGMSMMLLEVALNGTPLICSDIPENTDVLSANEVLYFESKNVVDLAQKIQYAREHHSEMLLKAQAARIKVMKENRIEVIVEQYIRLYHQVIQGDNRSQQ